MPESRRPKILIILMDDLAYGDLACHGNPHVRTPQLDALHGRSLRLDRHRSGPVCTPARASLMTGRYHLRTRAIDTYCGRSMIEPSEPSLARLLGGAGYRTGIFGKWHLGDCHPMRPMDCGFEHSLVHRAGGIGQPGDHPENARRSEAAYFDPWLDRDGQAEQVPGYCTDIFADATIDFIERHADAPWFCLLATNAPHTPLVVPEPWSEPYRDLGETWSRLYGMVANIDHNVGRVLAALEDSGVADDTIVIFTSDHGPCTSARDLARPPGEQVRFNAGLRGEKGSLYEGGIRVPCFWRWPATCPAGRDLTADTHVIDLLPTLLSAAGVAAPPDIDGCDLLPMIRGGAPLPARDLFFHWHRGDVPVAGRNCGVLSGRWKWYRHSPQRPAELFDLVADPGERQDRIAEHPELAEDLAGRYAAWFAAMVATRPEPFAPPRISIGHPDAATTVLGRQDWRVHNWDGWDERTEAHWEVLVDRGGRYHARLMLRQAQDREGELHLATPRQRWRAAVAAGQTELALPIELEPGPGTIEAWYEDAAGRQALLAVELRLAEPQPICRS